MRSESKSKEALIGKSEEVLCITPASIGGELGADFTDFGIKFLFAF
jgi:hypothetical protein